MEAVFAKEVKGLFSPPPGPPRAFYHPTTPQTQKHRDRDRSMVMNGGRSHSHLAPPSPRGYHRDPPPFSVPLWDLKLQPHAHEVKGQDDSIGSSKFNESWPSRSEQEASDVGVVLGCHGEGSTEEEGVSKNEGSILAKYIKRFRQAPPTSRSSRCPPVSSSSFWWKDEAQSTSSNTTTTTTTTSGSSKHAITSTPKATSQKSPSFTDPSPRISSDEDDSLNSRCRSLMERSSSFLLHNNGSTSSMESLPAQKYLNSIKHSSSSSSSRAKKCPSLVQPAEAKWEEPMQKGGEDDILTQWRVRRRLEAARRECKSLQQQNRHYQEEQQHWNGTSCTRNPFQDQMYHYQGNYPHQTGSCGCNVRLEALCRCVESKPGNQNPEPENTAEQAVQTSPTSHMATPTNATPTSKDVTVDNPPSHDATPTTRAPPTHDATATIIRAPPTHVTNDATPIIKTTTHDATPTIRTPPTDDSEAIPTNRAPPTHVMNDATPIIKTTTHDITPTSKAPPTHVISKVTSIEAPPISEKAPIPAPPTHMTSKVTPIEAPPISVPAPPTHGGLALRDYPGGEEDFNDHLSMTFTTELDASVISHASHLPISTPNKEGHEQEFLSTPPSTTMWLNEQGYPLSVPPSSPIRVDNQQEPPPSPSLLEPPGTADTSKMAPQPTQKTNSPQPSTLGFPWESHMNDELLILLITKAKLFEGQIREIDLCLMQLEEGDGTH